MQDVLANRDRVQASEVLRYRLSLKEEVVRVTIAKQELREQELQQEIHERALERSKHELSATKAELAAVSEAAALAALDHRTEMAAVLREHAAAIAAAEAERAALDAKWQKAEQAAWLQRESLVELKQRLARLVSGEADFEERFDRMVAEVAAATRPPLPPGSSVHPHPTATQAPSPAAAASMPLPPPSGDAAGQPELSATKGAVRGEESAADDRAATDDDLIARALAGGAPAERDWRSECVNLELELASRPSVAAHAALVARVQELEEERAEERRRCEPPPRSQKSLRCRRLCEPSPRPSVLRELHLRPTPSPFSSPPPTPLPRRPLRLSAPRPTALVATRRREPLRQQQPALRHANPTREAILRDKYLARAQVDLGTMTPVGRDQLLLDTCRVLQATSPPSAHEAW